MPTLTAEITHPDGSTDEVLATRSEEDYEFEHVDTASVFVDRPQVNEIDLEEDKDEIEIFENGERLFGGILRDTLRGGGEVELVLDSYERLALDGERSAGGVPYDNAPDTTIYSDAIDHVPELSEGSVESLNPTVTMVFSFASPAKRIRETAEKVNAEVMYRPDRTIDIVESLGSDRTDVVLSPSEQNISGDFNPERESGDDRVTHLIMLGAGEGKAQVQATVVPESDPRDYEGEDKFQNVHRYTADDWDEGDRRAWDAQTNKDVTDADLLADHALILIEEFNGEYIDVDVTVEDHDVHLGDWFTLEHPQENINHELRAVEVTRVVDGGGRRYECIFSNRRLTRQTDHDKVLKDTDRYNMAFEGSPVTLNTGGGRQPVDNGLPYQFSFYYPAEVAHEYRVKLQVKGFSYRHYSKPQSHNHFVTVDVSHGHSTEGHVHDVDITRNESIENGGINHNHDVPISATSDPIDYDGVYDVVEESEGDILADEYATTLSVPSGSDVWLSAGGELSEPDNDPVSVTVSTSGHSISRTVSHENQFEFGPAVSRDDHNGSFSVEIDTIPEGDIQSSSTIKNYVVTGLVVPSHHHDVSDTATSHTRFFDDVTETSREESEVVETEIIEESETTSSTTGVEPGVVETGDYPSNCEIFVNGSSVESGVGDGTGEFEATVDLRGELTEGAWNTIEVASDTLGHIQAALDVDVYRQILGRG